MHLSKKILIIDDFQISNEILGKKLESNGYKVVTSRKATEALQYLENGDFNLVITDYNMPETNGIVLAKKIKDKFKLLPILVFSSCKDKTLIENIDKKIITHWFHKPKEMDKLLKTIRQII